jgi:hypothetical protein
VYCTQPAVVEQITVIIAGEIDKDGEGNELGEQHSCFCGGLTRLGSHQRSQTIRNTKRHARRVARSHLSPNHSLTLDALENFSNSV